MVIELAVHDVGGEVEGTLRERADTAQQEVCPGLLKAERADPRRDSVGVERKRRRVVAAGVLLLVVVIVRRAELKGVTADDVRNVSECGVVAVVVAIRSEAAGATSEPGAGSGAYEGQVRDAGQGRGERQLHRARDIRRIRGEHSANWVADDSAVGVRIARLDQKGRAKRDGSANGVVVARRVRRSRPDALDDRAVRE